MVGSGTIKLSDINAELVRTAGSQISLTQAAEGVYATINTASALYPNGTAPHALSEWYSYHHAAVPPPATYTVGLSPSTVSGADACYNWNNVIDRTNYTSDTASPANGSSLFVLGTSTPAPTGYYSNGVSNWYFNGTTLSSETAC